MTTTPQLNFGVLNPATIASAALFHSLDASLCTSFFSLLHCFIFLKISREKHRNIHFQGIACVLFWILLVMIVLAANFVLVFQQQLWNFAQRTTALPFGRGAFTLATTYTLLTEVQVHTGMPLYLRLLILVFCPTF
jgi:hypothetical protein